MLRDRVISAVVAGAIILICTIAGGYIFLTAAIVLVSIGTYEFASLVAHRQHYTSKLLMVGFVAVFSLDRFFPAVELAGPGMAALVLLTLAWMLVRYQHGDQAAATGFAMTLAGSLYIGWVGGHFVGLRLLEDGALWTVTVFLSSALTDIAAYFAGGAYGHTPLAPAISPHKTWEGYGTGIVAGTLGAILLVTFWEQLGGHQPGPGLLHGTMIGFLIAALSPLGDLAISVIKRYAGQKDSGTLLPGHGGLLDRMDSLLIACLVGYYYIVLVIR